MATTPHKQEHLAVLQERLKIALHCIQTNTNLDTAEAQVAVVLREMSTLLE